MDDNTLLLTMPTGFPGGASGKGPACQFRRLRVTGSIPGSGRSPVEEGMATHSSILAWEILWTEEPGGLQSMGSQTLGRHSSDLARTQPYLPVQIELCFYLKIYLI